MVKSNSVAPSSPGRRALQAEQTRLEILGAARRLFAAEGYAATTLRHIASEAGVSVQTVFNSVGSKAELVRRLNDVIDREAGIGELAAEIATSTDPLAVAAIPARISCRIVERCGDLVRISLDAARSEKELAEVGAEGGRRHRAGAARVASRLGELDALSVDESAAATTIAALSEIRLALALLDDYGLDLAAVEQWIVTTTVRAVVELP